MDMWLYKYAQRLFQARWKCLKTGTYLEPTYPPYPGKASVGHDNVVLILQVISEIKCWSTHEIFNCTNDQHYGTVIYNKTAST